MKAAVVTAEWAPRPEYPITPVEIEQRMARIGSSVWKHPQVTVQSMPDPSPGSGEVLVRVAAAGLCGSDLHFFETDAEGYMKYPGMARFPSVPGHEVAGEVVAIGAGVKYLRPLQELLVARRRDASGHRTGDDSGRQQGDWRRPDP